MMEIFSGYAGAHGTHGSTSANDVKGGKLEIKKTARTVREPVTEELWELHLSGERPLGIIPIREDATCLWGCIDVDRYDISLADVTADLKKKKLPLVVCRSKSGGAHVFLFLREPVPAEELRARLRQVAASLGWGDCEVFPKQNQILGERGDLGNWLNMPYLGGDSTDRYAVKDTGLGMTVGEFLRHAEKYRVELDQVAPVKEKEQDEGLRDGPPCLEHLSSVGFPEGSRNNGLFALGTFCKKKFGAKWKDMLERYNRDFMTPPLPSEEVMSVIRSLEKKDYEYRCKDQPIASYCNSVLCRARKFGVGGSNMYPTIGGLSKLESEPPIWFLDIEDQRLELTTDELLNYRSFQKVAAEALTVAYMPMKDETWKSMLGEAMTTANIIEAPQEVSLTGQFMELLEEFLTDRHAGQTVDDLLLGKPWQDPESGRHYFRLQDLMVHLERKNFKVWGRNRVSQRVTDIGGKHFFNVRGRGVNVFWVEDQFTVPEPGALPQSNTDPI